MNEDQNWGSKNISGSENVAKPGGIFGGIGGTVVCDCE